MVTSSSLVSGKVEDGYRRVALLPQLFGRSDEVRILKFFLEFGETLFKQCAHGVAIASLSVLHCFSGVSQRTTRARAYISATTNQIR